MGFFRYFIKCIIRNIAWRICKPRNILIILIIGIVFFLFSSSCFATYAYEGEVVTVNPTEAVPGDQFYQYDNQFDHLYTMQFSIQERFIANCITHKGQEDYLQLVTAIFNECKNLGLSDKNIYIQYSSSGTNEFVVYYVYNHLLTYTVENNSFNSIYDQYGYTNIPLGVGTHTRVGYITAQNNVTTAHVSYEDIYSMTPYACLNVFNPSFIELFKIYGLVSEESSSELEALNRKAEQTNNSLNNINSSINTGNQLQQEQNNFLQQETTDDDVSIDGFNSVDSNDITSAGLSGIFTNIYSSITSWNSKDISLPIPYTNRNIIIPANYTENMLLSFGGNWVITFVSSIYYFIVARFIIYSITSIINMIKSGSILETDSKNNITTDML